MQSAARRHPTNRHSLCFMPAMDSAKDELHEDIKTHGLASSTVIVCSFVVLVRSFYVAVAYGVK